MKKPIQNNELEILSHKIANAINSENADLYSKLMSESESFRLDLMRWEIIAFRDRVHYLADNSSEIKYK